MNGARILVVDDGFEIRCALRANPVARGYDVVLQGRRNRA